MRERIALATVALVAMSCGPVRHVTIRADFDQVDKKSLLRLAVVTAPLPANDPAVGAMWSAMTRRYVNHHRDFIAKVERAGPALPEDACGEGIDGVLHLTPRVMKAEGGAEIEARGRLYRCRDGVEVWSAVAAGSWPSVDPHVSTVIEQYTEEQGEGVTPWVAPSFHALRALLNTLPEPVIEAEDDLMEKIELGE